MRCSLNLQLRSPGEKPQQRNRFVSPTDTGTKFRVRKIIALGHLKRYSIFLPEGYFIGNLLCFPLSGCRGIDKKYLMRNVCRNPLLKPVCFVLPDNLENTVSLAKTEIFFGLCCSGKYFLK